MPQKNLKAHCCVKITLQKFMCFLKAISLVSHIFCRYNILIYSESSSLLFNHHFFSLCEKYICILRANFFNINYKSHEQKNTLVFFSSQTVELMQIKLLVMLSQVVSVILQVVMHSQNVLITKSLIRPYALLKILFVHLEMQILVEHTHGKLKIEQVVQLSSLTCATLGCDNPGSGCAAVKCVKQFNFLSFGWLTKPQKFINLFLGAQTPAPALMQTIQLH